MKIAEENTGFLKASVVAVKLSRREVKKHQTVNDQTKKQGKVRKMFSHRPETDKTIIYPVSVAG